MDAETSSAWRIMELNMAGKYFDEWQIGETLTHDIRRTVTETDNLFFTVMTHNPQPLHLAPSLSA
jgi:acyl dehydratase